MTNQCVDVLKKGVRPRVARSDSVLGRKLEDEGVHVKLQCHMLLCKAERAAMTLDHFKERMKVPSCAGPERRLGTFWVRTALTDWHFWWGRPVVLGLFESPRNSVQCTGQDT